MRRPSEPVNRRALSKRTRVAPAFARCGDRHVDAFIASAATRLAVERHVDHDGVAVIQNVVYSIITNPSIPLGFRSEPRRDGPPALVKSLAAAVVG